MSTHIIPVLKFPEPQRHPNADSLDIVTLWGYTVVVRRGDFSPGELVAYIEPDFVVPEGSPWCAFLGKNTRIKAKKLRGIWSQGLLIRAPEGAMEGDNVLERLGIVRWEPPLELSTRGDAERPCPALATVPKYDVENWRRYGDLFLQGEEVFVTEKIHGANARFSFTEDRMWCGSRSQWKRQDKTDLWWVALGQNPWIESWCQNNPGKVLFGEVFGQVQDLRYDSTRGQIFFRAFDILAGNTWMDSRYFHNQEVSHLTSEQRVPLVYHGPYDRDILESLAMGDSKLAKHLAEGVVVKPVVERTTLEIGRVMLKLVSNRYLDR